MYPPVSAAMINREYETIADCGGWDRSRTEAACISLPRDQEVAKFEQRRYDSLTTNRVNHQPRSLIIRDELQNETKTAESFLFLSRI